MFQANAQSDAFKLFNDPEDLDPFIFTNLFCSNAQVKVNGEEQRNRGMSLEWIHLHVLEHPSFEYISRERIRSSVQRLIEAGKIYEAGQDEFQLLLSWEIFIFFSRSDLGFWGETPI